MSKMERLVCSKCGFKTNAVAQGATDVLCAGCFKSPQATMFKKGWLREEIEAASRDYENMPDWMKAEGNRRKRSGYADQ